MTKTNLDELVERADTLLEKGHIADARCIYRQVCDLKPDHVDARFVLGAIAAETGETVVAEKEFRAVLATDPSHADAHHHLAELLSKHGKMQKALNHAQHAVAQDDEYPEAWLLLSILQVRTGDLNAAYTSGRRAAELWPENEQAHLNLANVLRSLGRLAEAVTAFKRVLVLQPNHRAGLIGLAQIQLLQGSLREAAEAASTLLASQPDNAEAWFIQGVVHAQQEDLRQARDCFGTAVAHKPDYYAALINLGNANLGLADAEGAETAFTLALKVNPGQPDALAGLAEALNRSGRHQGAIAAAETGYRAQPDHAHCRLTLASALAAVGRDKEAENHFQALLKQHPGLVAAHVQLSQLYQRQGSIDAAVEHQREAVRLAPVNPQLYCGLARGLQLQGHFEEALASCDRALALEPDLTEAVALQAAILERQGKYQAAMAKLEPLLGGDSTDPGIALAFARLSPYLDRVEDAIALLETQLASGKLADRRQDKMHKMLVKLYDSCGDYERAFSHNASAHALRNTHFDADRHDAEVAAIIDSLDAAALHSVSGQGDPSERPVFIVGMPRSGTSLVEQILASHPSVFGGGELSDLPELAASLANATGSESHYPTRLNLATGALLKSRAQRYLEKLSSLDREAERITDKLPHNFLYLGVIQALFANARVIHIHRNPLDTCLSCYLQDFSSGHSYAYDLTQLGRYYRAYERIMDHWRRALRIPLMEIEYEDLIQNQERVSRALIKFCNLPWDDRCHRFHETRRTVTTPSYDQVRRPMYDSSIQRWHNYQPWLGPLLKALDEAGESTSRPPTDH